MTELAKTLLVGRAIITDENRLLVVRRAFDDLHSPGKWEFPGGKIDAGESIEAGLVREVEEETGLRIGVTSTVAHVESEPIISGRYEGRLYVALFYVASRLSGDFILSNEHSDMSWSEAGRAEGLDLTPESSHALKSLRASGTLQ